MGPIPHICSCWASHIISHNGFLGCSVYGAAHGFHEYPKVVAVVADT